VSPTVRRRRLAAELRRLRERLDLTGEEVARRLTWSAAKISRIETAKTGVKIADVRRLLELYGVSSAHGEELLALSRDAERKGWWEAYSDALPEEYAAFIGLEAEAESAAMWESQVIPGLFQTEDYARAQVQAVQPIVSIPPGQVEARVEVRLSRQQVLTREHPLALSVVVDESALMRRFGGNTTMWNQLNKVVELSKLPNVTLRILPLDGPNLASSASFRDFILMRFGQVHDVGLQDVVYVEQLTSSFYFEEGIDAYRYGLAFERLTAEALSPADSLQLIAETAERMWR
jgi:transcriptional regulator with XRE-family HTH domain